MSPAVESLSASTPTMRRASPLPFPAYPTPSPPWQNGSPTSNQPNSHPAGKTSQVIERITAENDRLRRELKAERAAKDEALQQQRALKVLVNQLEDRNNTLRHQLDTHDGALSRKERRLDDLKVALEEEARRRRRAEDRESEMGRKLGEITADASKQVAEAKLAAKASDAAYSAVSKEFGDLKKRVSSLQKDFSSFVTSAEESRRTRETNVSKLEVLLDQKRTAIEQATKTNREQGALLKQYKNEIEDTTARRREMIETTQQMRWLMGLQKARNESSPP